MDTIKMEIIEKKVQGVQIIKKQSMSDDVAGSFPSSSSNAQTVTIGLDEVLYEMLDKITGGERVRQIIPIVGMGGLGKTTLAQNIYENQLVKEYFYICAWSTISQVHNARKILTEILDQVGLDSMEDLSESDLGVSLYKHLIGKRYLIVMDDMWSIEAWDKVRSFLPDNGNGSRVVVTTRLSNLASMFDYSDGLDMKFLDEATSWNLFCKTVFGDGIFPPELEDVGKKILESCKGLPLSIVVVGGLLSKCEATRGNWKVIEENLSSVVNSEDDGSCLQTLYVSYNNLPIHLKPCFLYMGVFNEDEEIPAVLLITQWVAEGFLKARDGKSLEEVGEEYLEELVDRNLILVVERNHYGKLKSCKVHDLLRDLALREAEKDRFLCVLMQLRDASQGIISNRRRIINLLKEENAVALESVEGESASSLVRTLIGKFPAGILSLPSFRLMKVCRVELEEESNDEYYEEILVRLLNLRFVSFNADHPLPNFPSSISFLWNLQTLFLFSFDRHMDLDIWKLPLLRHVKTDETGAVYLPDPPPEKLAVLENLDTLSKVGCLKLSEEVLKRIPNVRTLFLYYNKLQEKEEEGGGGETKKNKGDYSFNNLHRLNKLQDLRILMYGWDSSLLQELILPYSLKQLALHATKIPWEEMASKIGCLPLLQVLILEFDSFVGSEWETVEGQFSSLKFLEIDYCIDLEWWTTESTHFPRLEHLVLKSLKVLSEIPSSIGDLPMLRSIRVLYSCDSVVQSARRILEEQRELGNEDIELLLR